MELTRHTSGTATLTIPSEFTQKLDVLLTSDIHFDSILCDIKLFEKHLKLAEELQAPVIIAGDFFDAMQSKDDPRRSPEELKEKYKVSHYLDAIVLDASDFLRQFKVPYYIIALGNHETAVLRKLGTNLCDRLAYDLRLHDVKAESMGYWAYIFFNFVYKKGNSYTSRTLYLDHGNGKSAAVTHGIIDVNRQSTWQHEADIVLNGHNHKSLIYPQPIERIKQKSKTPYNDIVWYLRTPGYKMSPGESLQTFGFGAEKYRSPTPKGCTILSLEYNKKQDWVSMEPTPKIS